tara:strand:- start:807 stop:1304 length:498 start_codon:yes stop_codon:yes gene_type:complete
MEDLNLTPEEILAIMKTISTKEVDAARKAIANDSQAEIDMTVRIKGLLKRGDAFSSKGTSRIPWKLALAIFLKRSGFTGPQTARMIADSIQEAIKLGKEADANLIKESGVFAALAIIDEELLKKLPKIQKNGNITFVPQMRQAIHAPVLVTHEDEHNASEVEAAK